MTATATEGRSAARARRWSLAPSYRGSVDPRIVTSLVAGQPTVSIDGVVDLAGVAHVRDAIQRAVLDHRGRTLRIDLDGVEGLDDSGLGVLVGAGAAARHHGGDVELVCSSPALLERLRVTRLDRIFEVRTSVA